MDRLSEFEIFLAILDTGSLAAAGRKLHRSPPAVTRGLAILEERLGTRLVERTTRQLAPTEAGKRLADQARRLLADYDAAIREDSTAPLRGLLRVTAPSVFGRRHVAPLVNSYLDRYPSMQVELILNDRNLELIDEGLDVAIRIGMLADTGMVARQVGEVRRILVASPDYLARHGTPASLDDLAQHEIIFGSSLTKSPEWRFRQGGRERLLHLTPRLLVNDVESVLMALKAGRGIARVLSYQPAEEIATGALVRLLAESEPPALPVHVVIASKRHMAPKLRAFLDHAVNSLEQLSVIRPWR
jgi:DNA-binding transcriptional LysR family regulator